MSSTWLSDKVFEYMLFFCCCWCCKEADSVEVLVAELVDVLLFVLNEVSGGG